MRSKDLLIRKENEVQFKAHPVFEGVKMKLLLSKEDNSEITIMQVSTKKGLEIPVHTHEADDCIYPLEGKAKLWVEESGDIELKPGVMVRVPKGFKHKVYKVEEDLLVYDVFSPATL